MGTGLVVLSARQTGIGEFQSGEGVIGLRRAFRHAGAWFFVMSMFAVPDESTHPVFWGGFILAGGPD
ncbi:MAG: CHAT domain-containing protein [candidate division Zixibacteria bacterium]|nr:CHAT domain-containing protein [candidate division Zixibacteria bacterium]